MMSANDARWEIRQTLRARNFEPDLHDAERYIGDLKVGHQTVRVSIEVRDLSFCALPRVHIQDRGSVSWDVLAHTQSETGICYGLKGFYSLDPAQPGAAIVRVLEDSAKTLLRSSKGRGPNEVAQEYAAYWGGPDYAIYSARPWSSKMNSFERLSTANGPRFLLAEAGTKVPAGYSRLKPRFCVIEISATARPARGILVPMTLSQLLDWLEALEGTGSIRRSVIEAVADGMGILIAAENGNYGAFFDLPTSLTRIKNPRRRFLIDQISKSANEVGLTQIRGTPCDLESITMRSLPRNTKTLSDFSVCLVGCGAIGGHLVRLLCQLGAGSKKSLTIIDPDTLKSGNVGRHALGFSYIDRPKAAAMAEELLKLHPDISVVAIQAQATDLRANIMRHDIIVDATGVENVSCLLNHWFREQGAPVSKKALFHSFLFGHGVAAQSFANLGNEFACFRCLRPSRNETWRHDPRKSDAQNDQPLDTGCGDGAFLPYGPYAGTAAASLTAQHIHEWIQGVRRHTLRTLIIDSERGKHVKPNTPPKVPDCPGCA